MTLLELLVVLVIAALMLALVAPNVARVLPGTELKGFALQTAALLRELRSEALTRVESRVLALVSEERRYRVQNGAALPWPEGVQVELEVNELPGGLQLALDQPGLVFYPDGSSNGGSLVLHRAEGDRYRIQVDAFTGRVMIDG
jgi:general secretion pathway protein H